VYKNKNIVIIGEGIVGLAVPYKLSGQVALVNVLKNNLPLGFTEPLRSVLALKRTIYK
jgi:hypothetical protein